MQEAPCSMMWTPGSRCLLVAPSPTSTGPRATTLGQGDAEINPMEPDTLIAATLSPRDAYSVRRTESAPAGRTEGASTPVKAGPVSGTASKEGPASAEDLLEAYLEKKILAQPAKGVQVTAEAAPPQDPGGAARAAGRQEKVGVGIAGKGGRGHASLMPVVGDTGQRSSGAKDTARGGAVDQYLGRRESARRAGGATADDEESSGGSSYDSYDSGVQKSKLARCFRAMAVADRCPLIDIA